ncbi:MAG: hypothetical protein ACREN5_13775 [Gemmatimonadales bacterium]
MLSALRDAGAEHLIVGAHALAAHGRPRATGDLDIWVRPSPENARRVHTALKTFGAPLGDLSVADLSSPDLVFQIGVAPARIDILTSVSGVRFEEAWPDRLMVRVGELDVPVIGRATLIRNKRAAGRPRDLADLADLEAEGTH